MYETECRHVAVQRGKQDQNQWEASSVFPGEVLSVGGEVPREQACSKVLNFLERMDDRIRCAHEEIVAVVKS